MVNRKAVGRLCARSLALAALGALVVSGAPLRRGAGARRVRHRAVALVLSFAACSWTRRARASTSARWGEAAAAVPRLRAPPRDDRLPRGPDGCARAGRVRRPRRSCSSSGRRAGSTASLQSTTRVRDRQQPREARLRQGLEIPRIEADTKIRAKYLQSPRRGALRHAPAETYVKGFLRTYADYLGLDGQLYVDEFNSRFAAAEEISSPSPPRAAQARPPAHGVEPRRRRARRASSP